MTTVPRPAADSAALLSPTAGNPRFPLFDSLRAVAALSVLLYHVGAIGSGDAGILRFLDWGFAVGVPIFFAISGFLLYRPFVNARMSGAPRPAARPYARRRVLRIVPAYWVALTVLGVAFSWSEVFGADAWRYYGFTQIYSERTFDGGLGVAWTLCIELSFYVLLPLFAAAVGRWTAGIDRTVAVRRETLLLLGLAVGSGVFRAVVGERSGYAFPTAVLPGTLLWFVPGMLLAVWSVAADHGPGGRLRRLLAPANGTAAWAVAAGAYAAVCLLGGFDVPRFVADDVATPVLTFCLLLPAVAGPSRGPTLRALPQRLLASSTLLWLGAISYGIYLYHATIVAWLDSHGAERLVPGLGWLGLAVTSVIGATVAGAVSWYAVERPALRRKVARRRRPVAHPAPRGAVLEPASERSGG